MGYGWSGVGWGGWLVLVAMMALFWAAVVIGIIALVNANRERHERSAPWQPGPERSWRPSALDTLDERFARGEIDAEEYTKRRDLLRSNR